MITSRSNSQYKRIKKLLSSSKARLNEGCFVVEGERIVKEAPQEMTEAVFVSASFAKGKNLPSSVQIFSDDVFKSLSDTVNPQGILAIIRQPVYNLKDIISASRDGGAFFLLLDDIRDPGNLGTIIRTAEAAGVSGVIMSNGCADISNPKVIRSTMGSIYRVPFVSCSLTEAVSELKKNKINIYAAVPEAKMCYNEAAYGLRSAFIIGNEARGISEEVLLCDPERIRIPMSGQVESLNAAISAAIIMYNYKNCIDRITL